MRDHLRLLPLLLVTWLTLCDSKSVDLLATVVLPSTRILGTVSMYKKICEKEELITDVVCELVDVDKTAYGELTKKNLDSQVKAINAASEFYEKTSTVDSQNLDKTLEGFGMLTGLKRHEAKFQEQFIEDARDEIKTSITVSTQVLNDGKDIDKDYFAKIKEALESVEKENVDNVKDPVAILMELRDKVIPFQLQLKTIKDYETEYTDFLSLGTMGEKTKDAIEVVKSIKSIFDNFDSIKVFDSIAPTLKEQLSKLKTGIAEFEKHATALTSIETSLPVIDRLKASKSKKSITCGLSKGAMDLKLVSTGLKSPWFKSHLVKKGDTENLKNFFLTISNTSSQLETAQVQRTKISGGQSIQKDFSDFVLKVTELAVIGKKAAQNQDAESALEAMVPCAQMMTQIATIPELKSTTDVAKYVEEVVSLVQAFESVVKEIVNTNLLESFHTDFGKLIPFTNTLKITPTKEEIATAWNAVKDLKLLKKYEGIWNGLLKFKKNPFYLKAEKLPTDILDKALKSAQDANIFEAVKCFPPTATSISDVIDFGKKSSELKAEKSKLIAVIPTLNSALAFSTSANKAIKTLKTVKSEENVKFICDLPEEFNKNVQSFLMTGDLISDLAKIEKNAAAIQKVSNPSDEVKQEIANIPGSEFYNDQYRKTLTDSWTAAKNTIKSVAAVKHFENLVEIFNTLVPNFKNVVVKDLKKLKYPIATELSKNSNEKMKVAAKSFEIVSDLNLNFTSYSGIALKMDFVKSTSVLFRPKSDAEQTTSFWSTWVGWLIIGVGASGVIAGIAVLAYCLIKKKKGGNVDLEKGKGGKNRKNGKNSKNKKGGKTSKSGEGEKTAKSKSTSIPPKGNKSESKEKTAATPSAESAALPATTSSSAEASTSNAGTPSPAAAK